MSDIQITIEDTSHLLVSINQSKFDAASAGDFKSLIEENWNDNLNRVTIDMSQVEFVDSSGVGALLSVQRQMPPNGEPVSLKGPRPNVVSVLELLRLQRVFRLLD